EYLPNSELFSVDVLELLKSLISAVDFLQSKNRIHGAIKPSNVFVNQGCVKFTDPSFRIGGSCQTEEDIRFSAPEILRGEPALLESDLYSVGAILYRLFTERNLFEDRDLTHLKAKYIWASPRPIENVCQITRNVADDVMLLLE